MISMWDTWGVQQNLTILHLDGCQVVQIKTKENGHNYTAMQLGVGEAKVKNVTKPVRNHQLKAGVLPKRKLMEFRVTEDAILPLGQSMSNVCNISLFQSLLQERRSTHSILSLAST